MRFESLFERAAAPKLFPRKRVHEKKLAYRAESLLECAAMLDVMKKFALVMMIMIMALPLQGLAASVISVCQNDPTHGSSVVKFDYQHADIHDRDAPAPDHDHPLAASDIGSDHCSSGSAFAVQVTATKLPATPNSGHNLFLPTSFSGHFPEQPQRPPRAVPL